MENKKNIWLLPTDKPSRLFKNKESNLHSFRKIEDEPLNNSIQNQNIYITSDEKIKPSDYYLWKENEVIKANDIEICFHPTVIIDCKKIILTTDEELIKNGIQPIDDEFLQWFVKNPNCEEIKWNAYPVGPNGNIIGTDKPYPFDGLICNFKIKYHIIIPKEESKQETVYYCKQGEPTCVYPKCVCNTAKPKEENKYPIGGYAPGNYSCKCVTCDNMFMGDKRAVQCEPCATRVDSFFKDYPSEEEIKPPIGKFIIDNAVSIQGADGAYYHYSEVCKLLKLQAERNELRLKHKKALLANCEKCLDARIKQTERMVSKEACEDSLNMQKASNQGYESKIAELKEQISKMHSNEELRDIISKISYKLQFYFSDNLKDQIADELFNQFEKK